MADDKKQKTDIVKMVDFQKHVAPARKPITDFIALEIPPGSPQLRYNKESDQWVPRGSVLRCLITDSEEGYLPEVAFEIDGKMYSLEEFGRIMLSYAGWGCRITFCDQGDTEVQPETRVGEPNGSSISGAHIGEMPSGK